MHFKIDNGGSKNGRQINFTLSLKSSIKINSQQVIYSRLPWWLSDKESACNLGDADSIPGLGRFPWKREWQSIPVFLPGESHRHRSLAGYIAHGVRKSQTRMSD